MPKREIHPVMGTLAHDPMSDICGSDIDTLYWSPHGIGGVCTIEEPSVRILTCVARIPGQGQFTAFLAAAKEHFRSITFHAVWNGRLHAFLLRNGFQEKAGNLVWTRGEP